MSSPPAPRHMAKRRSSQKRVSYVETEFKDFSDDEPLPRKKGSRAKRSSAAADLDESGPEEDISDSDHENVAGPSNRVKKVSKGKKGKSAKQMQKDQEDEEPAPSKRKSAANTSKKARKSSGRDTQGTRGARGDADDPDEGSEEEEDADEDLLQEAIDSYTYEAGPGATAEHALSSSEEGNLVRSVMRFLILRQRQKPDVPVKREELAKLILNNYRGQRVGKHLVSSVLKTAAAKFPVALGMEMKEITLKTQTKHGEVDGGKVIVLRSLLPAKLRALVKAPAVETNQAFAMVVLPLIVLAGGKLSEGEVGMHLEKIGVNMTHDHPTLGKPADQLQELVNKKLLAKSREPGADSIQNMYAINSLAHEDITEGNLKDFIDKVFGMR